MQSAHSPSPPTDSRLLRFAKWLPFCLFFLTLATRILVLHRFFETPFFSPDSGDAAFYNEWALRILDGQFSDGQAFYGLPGYAWLLAGIYAVFGYTPYVPALLQCFVEAATAVIVFRIGSCLFPGGPKAMATGTLAAVAWTFFIPAQAFSIVLMPTCYVALAFWGLVLWALRVSEDGSRSIWVPWAWMGLIVGVTSMFVATIFFVLPVILFASARTLRWPRTVAAAGVLISGVLLGCSPCWIHNYLFAKEPVLLSAHSGINFYVGNNPEATGYPKIPAGLRSDQEGMLKDSILVAERKTGRNLRRFEVSRFWSENAKEFIQNNPGKWLQLMALKVRNLFNGYQYDDLSLIALLRSQRIILFGVGFGILAAFAIPGAFLLPFVARRSLWVSAAVLLYLGALLPVFVTERYRLPAAPGLAVLAAGGLVALAQFIAMRRWIPISVYAGMFALAGLLVRWPVATPEMLALDHYNVGNNLLRAGELKRASQYLNRALVYSPDSAEINFALGNLALEKDERTEAKGFYRRTLELNPSHSSAYNNLGVMAEEEDRLELARRFFSMSIAAEPDDAKSWYLFARVELRLGDRDAARKAIERALELSPLRPQLLALRDEISRADARPLSFTSAVPEP